MENLLDKTTQLWVKWTGQRIEPDRHAWLMGPVGDADLIGDKFIARLIRKHKLEICDHQNSSGLLENIQELGFSEAELERLRPEVIDFYQNTSDYELECWSAWAGLFRPFGWLLAVLFSRRLQQLNLPLNPLDVSKGMNSRIIKLNEGKVPKWTIWYRLLRSNQRVIYSGIYTTCQPENHQTPLLKVIFPLPNGNASVIMNKVVKEDGSLLLASDGEKFGEQGFYFTLTDHKGKHWAKYVRAMHEWIRVYVDEEDVLRADHNLNFFGLRFLNLHYKMKKRKT